MSWVVSIVRVFIFTAQEVCSVEQDDMNFWRMEVVFLLPAHPATIVIGVLEVDHDDIGTT